MSKSKKILFVLTGSIAAYKACMVISQLVQLGHEVQTVLTGGGQEFVGEATLEGLTRKTVVKSLYQSGHMMDHINLERWADLIIVAPATAHAINSLASGLGSDLLSTLFLAHKFQKPFLLAPAMNTSMYLHPITQKSLAELKQLGVIVLESASGVLACGEVGWGRLLEPDQIVKEITNQLEKDQNLQSQVVTKVPAHKPARVLITSGATSEPIDAVRVLTNLSRGTTGAEIAKTLVQSGFHVTYLHGQNSTLPSRVSGLETQLIPFTDFKSFETHFVEQLKTQTFDAVIHLAALSDYSPVQVVNAQKEPVAQIGGKLSSQNETVYLELKRNRKLIKEVKNLSLNKNLFLVGFKLTAKASASDKEIYLRSLFNEAHCDLVVHNDLDEIDHSKNVHPFHVYDSKSPQETIEGAMNLSLTISLKITNHLIQKTKELI